MDVSGIAVISGGRYTLSHPTSKAPIWLPPSDAPAHGELSPK